MISCMRNFVFSMFCFLASSHSIWGLAVSSQNLKLDVGHSDLYNASSPSASVGATAQNLTVIPNPFYDAEQGYVAEYLMYSASAFHLSTAQQLLIETLRYLLNMRRRAGTDDLIPGGRVVRSKRDLHTIVTWEIQGVLTTGLSYLQCTVAITAAQALIEAYYREVFHQFMGSYSFVLYNASTGQPVARGWLREEY